MKVIRHSSSSCKFLHPTSCFWNNSLNQSICICIYLSLTLQFICLLYIWLTVWSFTMQCVLEHTYKNFSSLEYELKWNHFFHAMQAYKVWQVYCQSWWADFQCYQQCKKRFFQSLSTHGIIRLSCFFYSDW